MAGAEPEHALGLHHVVEPERLESRARLPERSREAGRLQARVEAGADRRADGQDRQADDWPAARGGCRPQPARAASGEEHEVERQRIAVHVEPSRRRNGHGQGCEQRRRRGCRRARHAAPARPRVAPLLPDGRQGSEPQRRHHQRDRLIADGEAQPEQDAGDPARAPVIQAANEEDEPCDGAQDLRVVVIDATGPELRQRQGRGGDEHHRERGAHRTGAPVRLAGDDQRQREEQERGPDDARRQLRPLRAEERCKGADQGRERQVDQARPVRHEWLGRADARQRRVEPGRAAEELAHRDEPHGIVGVAEPIGERRSGARKRGDDEEDGCEQRQAERRGGPLAERRQARQHSSRNQHRHRRHLIHFPPVIPAARSAMPGSCAQAAGDLPPRSGGCGKIPDSLRCAAAGMTGGG